MAVMALVKILTAQLLRLIGQNFFISLSLGSFFLEVSLGSLGIDLIFRWPAGTDGVLVWNF